MKRFLILAVLLAPATAFAQTQEANAVSGSIAGSESTSGAINSGVSQGITINYPDVPETQTFKYDQSGGYKLHTTAAAVAPALTTTLTETCMGSASVGVAVTGWGVSGGKTYVDEECVRRLHSRELRAMGFLAASAELMCGNEEVAAAMDRAGTPCGGLKQGQHGIVQVKSPPAPAAVDVRTDRHNTVGHDREGRTVMVDVVGNGFWTH